MAPHRIADRTDAPPATPSRRDLLRGAVAGSIAGLSGTWPALAFAAQAQEDGTGQAAGSAPPSLSRRFARWVTPLRFEDLPPAVIDRAKGLTLHGLGSRR
jgi:hypothetical protein